MTPLQTRFIQPIGTQASLVLVWETLPPCPSGSAFHRTEVELKRSDKIDDWGMGGTLSQYRDYPTNTLHCDRCGVQAPEGQSLGMSHRRLYNTASGQPEPGDIYFVNLHDPDERCHYGWTNCDGQHMHVIMPNGFHWDGMARASNCTMKDDTIHRCWIIHGDPRLGHIVHVDKQGHTCAAGAGSIVCGNYHGFLHDGKLT